MAFKDNLAKTKKKGKKPSKKGGFKQALKNAKKRFPEEDEFPEGEGIPEKGNPFDKLMRG